MAQIQQQFEDPLHGSDALARSRPGAKSGAGRQQTGRQRKAAVPSASSMPFGGIGWLAHAAVTGSAALIALAATIALRRQAGLEAMAADTAAAAAFTAMLIAHFVLRPGLARPESRFAPQVPREAVQPRAAQPFGHAPGAGTSASAAVLPDRMHAALQSRIDRRMPVTANSTRAPSAPPVATAAEGFEHLQALVAELARTTPGPKATTPDPDGPVPSPSDLERSTAAQAAALTEAVRAMAARSVSRSAPPRAAAQPTGMAGQLTEALAAGRMTVYLEPIQQITNDQPRHYEVSVRFTAADGHELPHDDLLAAARDAGLLARVDAAVLPRAAKIAQHFRRRGRDTDILSRVHGESLPDSDFRAGVTAATIAADGAALVLSFAQDDVGMFGPIHWDILSAISEMGLRFAIENVTHLDMNFEALHQRGFNFVKLDPDVLIDGLPADTGVIAAADVCRYFASSGLALVVNHIEDEAMRARLLGFGVLFGQGTLFGTRRAVRADLLTAPLAA